MVKENHYMKCCHSSWKWERTGTTMPLKGFPAPRYMTSKIYIYPLQYHKETWHKPVPKGLSVRKGSERECLLRWRADMLGEWTPVCTASVSVLHHCHTTIWRADHSALRPNCAVSKSAETSHTTQLVPYKPTQRHMFVVPQSPTTQCCKGACKWLVEYLHDVTQCHGLQECLSV